MAAKQVKTRFKQLTNKFNQQSAMEKQNQKYRDDFLSKQT